MYHLTLPLFALLCRFSVSSNLQHKVMQTGMKMCEVRGALFTLSMYTVSVEGIPN